MLYLLYRLTAPKQLSIPLNKIPCIGLWRQSSVDAMANGKDHSGREQEGEGSPNHQVNHGLHLYSEKQLLKSAKN